ncbi:MAG: (Fe-S)-binding protein [Chloroflexota bacterium]
MPLISNSIRAIGFAVILLISFGVFFQRAFQLVDYMRLGKGDDRLKQIGERIKSVLVYVGLHKTMFRISYSGILHLFIFYAFVILFTVILATLGEGFFGPTFELPLISQVPILVNLLALAQDTIIVLALVGLGMAFYQRLFRHPERFKGSDESDAFIILGMITGVVMTTLFALSARQALGWSDFPVWAAPARTFLGGVILGAAGEGTTKVIYEVAWWGHALVVFSFLPYLLHSKHMHVIVGVPNVLLRDLTPRGRLEPLNLEDESVQVFGVGEVTGFSWKHILDFYACTECGRCQAVCPAHTAGKPLSPKLLIMDLRDHLDAVGPNLLAMAQGNGKGNGAAHKALVGESILDDTLWACTTCAACVHECPLFIEHVDDIVDMRRYLTLTEARIPDSLGQTLNQVGRTGNPWGQPAADRLKWADGLNVPVMAKKKEAEVLYWVGCAGAYDPNGQKTSRAVVKILQAAGVDFAVLGQEERCNCEWARRAGDEYTYQEATRRNIDVFGQYQFKTILTHCPHCFNTLANEYGDFGGHYEVVHHSQYISRLIAEGRITPKQARNETITFHDACYLGRYNDIYDDPRRAITAIPGVKLAEIERSRDRGMCCGGGGANVWYEIHGEREINEVRLDQLMEAKPQTVGAACPYCRLMLNSAVETKGVANVVAVKDIAELVSESL